MSRPSVSLISINVIVLMERWLFWRIMVSREATSALHGPDFQRKVLPYNVYYHMAYGDLAVDAEHMDDAHCCYMEAL